MDIETISLLDHSKLELGAKLGEGAFGVVRRGLWTPRNLTVAVKLEPIAAVKTYLFQEIVVVKALQSIPHVPRLLAHGATDHYNYMVTELLGDSINDKFRQCGRHFSLPTVITLADEMLKLLESIHKQRYVHRDIKPHNFLIGTEESQGQVYIIDFGLARRIANGCSQREYGASRRVCGTLPFVALNIHLGMQFSFRDDLESLGYMLIYFLQGALPWYNPHGEKLPEYRVRKSKQETQVWTLCRDLPPQFEQYFNYVRGLKMEQDPDYNLLRALFAVLARDSDFPLEVVYDWESEKNSRKYPRRGSTLISRTGISYTQMLSATLSDERPQENPAHRRVGSCPFVKITKRKITVDSVVSPITPGTTSSSHQERRHSGKFVGLKELSTVTVASKNKFGSC